MDIAQLENSLPIEVNPRRLLHFIGYTAKYRSVLPFMEALFY